jgi:hypothetical protein
MPLQHQSLSQLVRHLSDLRTINAGARDWTAKIRSDTNQ